MAKHTRSNGKPLMDGRRFLYEVVKLYANGAE
jgi:hypothetical protein